MNTCKHFDLDNQGNRICLLGGLCDNPDTCRNKTEEKKGLRTEE